MNKFLLKRKMFLFYLKSSTINGITSTAFFTVKLTSDSDVTAGNKGIAGLGDLLSV